MQPSRVSKSSLRVIFFFRNQDLTSFNTHAHSSSCFSGRFDIVYVKTASTSFVARSKSSLSGRWYILYKKMARRHVGIVNKMVSAIQSTGIIPITVDSRTQSIITGSVYLQRLSPNNMPETHIKGNRQITVMAPKNAEMACFTLVHILSATNCPFSSVRFTSHFAHARSPLHRFSGCAHPTSLLDHHFVENA